MTATNGVSSCGFVSVRVCACVIPWDPTAAAVPRVDSRGGHSAFCNLFFVFAIHACLLLLLCACITPKAFDVVGCGSHGITAVAVLQGLRFVTATNGASVCACVRIMWECHPEHNEGHFPISTLPLMTSYKSIRAVQQRYNTTSSPSSTRGTPGTSESTTGEP